MADRTMGSLGRLGCLSVIATASLRLLSSQSTAAPDASLRTKRIHPSSAKFSAILRICAYGEPIQAGFPTAREGDKAIGLFSLLNPINHARTRADVYRYKVEPYVVSADIYAVAPHVGRGGWTWYTGSAGWMQRAGIEGILGLRIRGTSLHLDPCIPKAWPGFGVVFRYRSARYEIQVENPQGVSGRIQLATLDGETLAGNKTGIPLTDDGATHQIRIVLG